MFRLCKLLRLLFGNLKFHFSLFKARKTLEFHVREDKCMCFSDLSDELLSYQMR